MLPASYAPLDVAPTACHRWKCVANDALHLDRYTLIPVVYKDALWYSHASEPSNELLLGDFGIAETHALEGVSF